MLTTLRKRGHRLRTLALAPDRSPIVAVKAGGDRLPAIFISAGSHSTEHAGVVAAVELADQLKTDHELYIIPCRDPIGLNGFRYALGLGLESVPDLTTPAEAERVLRDKGEVLYDADGRLLVILGEHGYANRGLYRRIDKGAAFLEALAGRRIWFPARYDDVPGTGPLERAYTLVVTPDREILHLNRFHDTPWAPAEVRATRNLMAEIKPGLVLDLHEYHGATFWFSARHQRHDEDQLWEGRMAAQIVAAVKASGAPLAAPDYSPGSFFSRAEQGLYWLDPSKRGEGLNLVDFAARRYGPGFTIENGMQQPFADRVRYAMVAATTAVKVFESRYA